MTHGPRPRCCRICGNLLSPGGAWYKCSRCGWTDKPKSLEEQERIERARKFREASLRDVIKKETPQEKRKREMLERARRRDLRQKIRARNLMLKPMGGL